MMNSGPSTAVILTLHGSPIMFWYTYKKYACCVQCVQNALYFLSCYGIKFFRVWVWAWLDTAVHLWFDLIIRRTPHGPLVMPACTGVVQACRGISNIFHILRDLYGAHVGPTLRELTKPECAKILQGHHMWLYRAHMGPYSPHTGCLRSLNLCKPVSL